MKTVLLVAICFFFGNRCAFSQEIPPVPENTIYLYPRAEVREKINSHFKHIPKSWRYPVGTITIKQDLKDWRYPDGIIRVKQLPTINFRGYIFDVKDRLPLNSITSKQLDIFCGKPKISKDYSTYQLIGKDGTKKYRGTYFLDAKFVNLKLDSYRIRGDGISKQGWQTTKVQYRGYEN